LVDNLKAVLSALKSNQKSTHDDCKNSNNTYENQESARKQQLLTLEKLINYFNDQVVTAVNNIN